MRRQQEVTDATAAAPTVIIEDTEKSPSGSIACEVVTEADIHDITVKVVENPAENSCTTFKCDQCAYTNLTEKGVKQHTRMKHRISQVDGMYDEEDLEEINCVSYTYQVKVTENKTIKNIENDLTYTTLWDNIKISHFMVEEESDNFSVKVTCSQEDYPDDFNDAWMVNQLQSLPWPQGYSIICSHGPSYSKTQ